jgi:hypothetical protein
MVEKVVAAGDPPNMAFTRELAALDEAFNGEV